MVTVFDLQKNLDFQWSLDLRVIGGDFITLSLDGVGGQTVAWKQCGIFKALKEYPTYVDEDDNTSYTVTEYKTDARL